MRRRASSGDTCLRFPERAFSRALRRLRLYPQNTVLVDRVGQRCGHAPPRRIDDDVRPLPFAVPWLVLTRPSMPPGLWLVGAGAPQPPPRRSMANESAVCLIVIGK